MKYIKIFENYNLEQELEKFGIQYYTINNDGTIDVNGTVYLAGMSVSMNMKKIPFKFGKVTGDFHCSYNNLESLDGCPYYVGGNFYCNNNKLNNLIGGPEDVNLNYLCFDNSLTTLDGLAHEIGGYLDCRDNQLTKLNVNLTPNIGGSIFCFGNNIDPNKNEFTGYCGGEIVYDDEE